MENLSPFASWPCAINNPQWLELPMFRTNFYGLKDVRAIYIREIKHNTVPCNLFFNKRICAVVMSPDSEGLGAAIVAGVGSNLTQLSGISYLSLYTFFSVLASVMILGRNSLLKFV